MKFQRLTKTIYKSPYLDLHIKFFGIFIISISCSFIASHLRSGDSHYDIANWAINEISPEDIHKRGSEVIFLDTRPLNAFEHEHIDHAISFSVENWDSSVGTFLDKWYPGTPIIIYCGNISCGLSKQLAIYLLHELPESKVFFLSGGFAKWQAYQAQLKPAS
jgi:3-mercaptopyruvate sulfurtransferase SseA